MPRYKPVLERFSEKYVVNPETGCWDWQGGIAGIGYGMIRLERSRGSAMAHRFSYEYFRGPIPDGMIILHDCDNPACVNPLHLSLGTHQDNMNDMARKGRARVLSSDEVIDVERQFAMGESMSSIARRLGVSRSTVTRALVLAGKGDYGGAEGRRGSKYYTILSENDRETIKAMVSDGALSIMEIAKRFNVDRRTVRNIRDGKLLGRYAKLTREKAREVVDLWEAGQRQWQIAQKFGISQTQVSKIVRGTSWSGIKSKANLPKMKPPPIQGMKP